MSAPPIPAAFTSDDGVTLRGDLWLPDGAGTSAPAPGVVMSHGFSATRQMALPAFAERFAAAGLAVLLYDHRNLGASDGPVRQEIDPWRQALDMAAAAGWLAARPEVDGDRLGAWGSSFSAGEVIALASVDRRLKAVVANAPFAGLGDLDPEDHDAIDARYSAISEVLTGVRAVPPAREIGPMAVVLEPGADGPAFLPQPEASEWFLAHGPGTGWENRFTLRMTDDPPFDPYVCARHVAPCALLMVVADQDVVAPTATALAAYGVARQPKQLLRVPGHHFADYAGEGFERVVPVMTEFLLTHL